VEEKEERMEWRRRRGGWSGGDEERMEWKRRRLGGCWGRWWQDILNFDGGKLSSGAPKYGAPLLTYFLKKIAIKILKLKKLLFLF
jgi:hypothetical protein